MKFEPVDKDYRAVTIEVSVFSCTCYTAQYKCRVQKYPAEERELNSCPASSPFKRTMKKEGV
jgi:hypothetical protein